MANASATANGASSTPAAAATPLSSSTTPVLEQKQPRFIPGLHLPNTAPPVTKSRSRSKKNHAPTPSTTAEGGVNKKSQDVASAVRTDGVATSATIPPIISESLVAPVVELEAVEEKKTSAVEAVHKRIRAANKKIQRIITYEEKTEALNADQQKAVASKPTVEAIVKELKELLEIVKAEEVEDDARLKRISAAETKKHSLAVTAAVASHQKESESTMVLLLQFLHLHALYTQQNNGFAPAVLPSVVANATGQEVAAVRMLYDAFTNGPLLGGHGDAIEKLNKIAQASSEEVLPAVPYSRVRELIAGLTSPPQAANESIVTQNASQPAGPSDSVVALVDGDANTGAASVPTPSFLQASELEDNSVKSLAVPTGLPTPTAEEKVTSWADEVEDAATTGADSSTSAVVSNGNHAQLAPTTKGVTNGNQAGLTGGGWGQPPALAKPLDWSAEESTELPSLEGLVSPETLAKGTKPALSKAVESDGFLPAKGSRRGPSLGGEHQHGHQQHGHSHRPGQPVQQQSRPRGSFRGGEGRGGGRGSFRGSGRGVGPDGVQQQQQGPRIPRTDSGDATSWGPRSGGHHEGRRGGYNNGGEQQGDFRGGRGGGGRGGRGGINGGRGPSKGPPTPAPAVSGGGDTTLAAGSAGASAASTNPAPAPAPAPAPTPAAAGKW